MREGEDKVNRMGVPFVDYDENEDESDILPRYFYGVGVLVVNKFRHRGVSYAYVSLTKSVEGSVYGRGRS